MSTTSTPGPLPVLAPISESNPNMIDIKNPSQILQQQKSNIITNPFIPDTQKQMELDDMTDKVNNIILQNYNNNISSSIHNLSLSDINKNISKSCIGILDDAFNKPEHVKWTEYIQIIIKKDQRYTYLGFLLIFIAFYILLVSY